MSDAPNITDSIDAVIGPDEELVTLTQVTRHLPKVDGKKVSTCTVWRWCRKGLRGVFLQYVRVGRRVCTSRPALLRFFAELADLDRRIKPVSLNPRKFNRKPVTSKQRLRALQEADAVLERAGI
jgi:hypothetical protein